MEIKNSTVWENNDLRKLFRKCVQEVEKVEASPSLHKFSKRHKNFILEIQNTSHHSLRGRATVNGYWIFLRIPKHWSNPEIKIDERVSPIRYKEL